MTQRPWLVILIVASLALNVGTIGGYGWRLYVRAREASRNRQVFRRYPQGTEIRILGLIDTYRDERRELDSLRILCHEQLEGLRKAPDFDTADVNRWLDLLADTHREIARLGWQVGRDLRDIRNPEQRARTERTYRRYRGLDPDSSATPPDTNPTPRRSHILKRRR